MPRHSRDPKGDTRHYSVPMTTPTVVDSPQATPLTSPSPHLAMDSARQLMYNLQWFMDHDGGWLRIVPQVDAHEVFFKWKFTTGPWAGHYVMSRTMHWQYAYGLEVLRQKVEEVEEGSRRPTRDTPYQ